MSRQTDNELIDKLISEVCRHGEESNKLLKNISITWFKDQDGAIAIDTFSIEWKFKDEIRKRKTAKI